MQGYLALTILLHENHEMLPLIIQSLQNDLNSRNDNHQCLALATIANIGGREMSESLSPIIQKLLLSKYAIIIFFSLIVPEQVET
jgi:AP-2 complex subunit alpha